MNAERVLVLASNLLRKHRLDVVLIGNAAAALQGSPVTTLDLDFMFRRTPTNLKKLKRLADDLEAVVMRPYYPASDLYRVVRDRDGLQLDFMGKVDGIRSFERLRADATRIEFGESAILVASLRDIIRSKRSAGRLQPPRSSALRRESDRALVEQIRRLLALPPAKRTNFLRVRVNFGATSI